MAWQCSPADGLSAGDHHEPVRHLGHVHTALGAHQLEGTLGDEVNDDISGGTTTDDPSRAVRKEDDDAIFEINDDGPVVALRPTRSGAGGVGDGEGHGVTTEGTRLEFRMFRTKIAFPSYHFPLVGRSAVKHKRFWPVVLAGLLAAGCGPSRPSSKTVHDSIKYVVLFRIQVDWQGYADGCDYQDTMLLTRDNWVNFRPSSKFIQKACTELMARRWRHRTDAYEHKGRRPTSVGCYFSTATPDDPVCYFGP